MRKLWVALLGWTLILATASPAAARAQPAGTQPAGTQTAPAPTALSTRPDVKIINGEWVWITGYLTSARQPQAGRRVVLMTRAARTGSRFNAVAGATTDARGFYGFDRHPSEHQFYYVSFAGSAELLPARSGTTSIRVRASVRVEVTPAQHTPVVVGEVRRLSGRVAPESKGDHVLIQVASRGQWRNVAKSLVVGLSSDPRSSGYFRWSYRFSRLGPMKFRVVYPETSKQDGNASRTLPFVVQRWHRLVDLQPLRTAGGVAVSRTDARFGAEALPNSLKLARQGSAGSVSYDLRGGCSAFAGRPVVYRGEPRAHPVRFLVKLDGVAQFDATARMDQQFQDVVAGKVATRRTLELVVAGPGTGLIDLWFGAQILCSW